MGCVMNDKNLGLRIIDKEHLDSDQFFAKFKNDHALKLRKMEEEYGDMMSETLMSYGNNMVELIKNSKPIKTSLEICDIFHDAGHESYPHITFASKSQPFRERWVKFRKHFEENYGLYFYMSFQWDNDGCSGRYEKCGESTIIKLHVARSEEERNSKCGFRKNRHGIYEERYDLIKEYWNTREYYI